MHIRVLIVDDFPLVREGLAVALNSDPGIEVVGQAGNAVEALERAKELRPDVILLDMRMPGGDGLSLLQQLPEELPGVRVLVMSATERTDVMLDAISAGANGYLSKRATQEELRQAVITVHGGGSALSPEFASVMLRDYAATARGAPLRPRALLTPREQEVLTLVSRGLTDQEIGERLYISPRTVQNQLAAIRQKTGIKRRSELTRWAVEHLS